MFGSYKPINPGDLRKTWLHHQANQIKETSNIWKTRDEMQNTAPKYFKYAKFDFVHINNIFVGF